MGAVSQGTPRGGRALGRGPLKSGCCCSATQARPTTTCIAIAIAIAMTHRGVALMPDARPKRAASFSILSPRSILAPLRLSAAVVLYASAGVYLLMIPSSIALWATVSAFLALAGLELLYCYTASPATMTSGAPSTDAADDIKAKTQDALDPVLDEEPDSPGRSLPRWIWFWAFNTTVFLWVVDAAFSPYMFPSHYARHLDMFRSVPLGPTRARVHVRFPFPFGEEAYLAALGGAGEDPFATEPQMEVLDPVLVLNPYPLRIVYREAPLAGDTLLDSRWERGPLLHLTENRDWTSTATLSDLWPSTAYEWTLAFSHNNTRPLREQVRRFTTFPDPRMPRPKLPTPAIPATRPVAVEATATATAVVESEETEVEVGTDSNATDPELVEETVVVKPVDEWAIERPYPIVERPLPTEVAPVPEDDPYHFTFGSASCVKADVPWRPQKFKLWSWLLRASGISSASRNQIVGLDLLADRVAEGGLRFFLQLGDWIYADVPWFTSSTTRDGLLSHYRNLYRAVYASAGWQRLAQLGLPFYGAADDHEVLNNWSGLDERPEVRKAVRYGVQAWFEYVGMANPRATVGGVPALDEDEVDQDALDQVWNTEVVEGNLHSPVDEDPPLDMDFDDVETTVVIPEDGIAQDTEPVTPPSTQQPPLDAAAPLPEAWYDFRYGDTAYFVLDARRYREPPKKDGSGSVLGEAQTAAFLDWLKATNDSSTTFKFVISSFPFTSLWAGGWDVDARTDSWAAYLGERDFLLSRMASVPNVIVLSGDRHEFVAAALAPKKSEEQEEQEGYSHWPVVELSTSPLNMFYLPVRTAKQEHGRGATGQEQLVKYLPDGNVKWTEFEVDTRDSAHPVVHTVVYINGKPAWAADIIGTPVHKARRSAAQALGQVAKSLLEWLGFEWFLGL